jgi:hypothetical protein
MSFTLGKPRNRSRSLIISRHVIVPLFLVAFASVASAQLITPTPDCASLPAPFPGSPGSGYALYPTTPLTYPVTSDRYAVQYKLDNGDWTDAQVYISRYGGSNASPYLSYSGYTETTTSMSFVSIPAHADAYVQLRVTKLWSAPFLESDRVSVRPSAKFFSADLADDGTVRVSTLTGPNFAGDQFILWWERSSEESGALQGIAFFLDPPYVAPTGSNVRTVTSPGDLDPVGLVGIDTLAFQGTVAIATTGAQAYAVPASINTIYLAPGAWVQGKLAFAPSSSGSLRRIYGPGVLDVSRFEYDLRHCDATSGFADQGDAALAAVNPDGSRRLDSFALDGVIISDNNFYSTDSLTNSTVNNVKVIAWNANNDGLQFGSNTTATNVFVRSGDDSLKMWGSSDTVTNATVWQNYNGGVVSLGWSDNSPGDDGLIDQLYVVKTDWFTPTDPTWIADPTNPLVHQNNAVIASMMVPGTRFGAVQPSLYRNIFVEDPPQVLFSLKVVPPALNGNSGQQVDLMDSSALNLNLENVFTPPSIAGNSIGFQSLPAGYTFGSPLQSFPTGYTLAGSMNIGLTNVLIKLPDGIWVPLVNITAGSIGKVRTNGQNVNVNYRFGFP